MQEPRGFAGLTVLSLAFATSIVHSAGCTTEEPDLGQTESAATVADYGSTGCSTAVVIGLSKQIAQEADCEHPGNFVAITATGGITITSNAVLPYLDKSARDDLQKVAAAAPIQVNSALRTLAQQYLLYRWYEEGRCGITAAATVGNSNHEGGRAVDLANYSTRISAMSAHGWAHDVPGDDVHFDHTASTDHRGEDVHAFQVLWNKNHPNDQIAEDGDYGPMTEARLRASPAGGFAIGPSCMTGTPQTLDLDVVSWDGPDRAAPQTQVHYGVTVKNTGNTAWPATTKLILKGASSVLYDPSWMSQTDVTALGASVDAGKTATIDFDVTTPPADADTPIMEAFQLADGSAKFGEIDLALTVVPGDTGNTSSDGGDTRDGGCNVGDGAGWVLALGVIFVRRRRRS
jgi:MYXO-CTERM domain-containing protein